MLYCIDFQPFTNNKVHLDYLQDHLIFIWVVVFQNLGLKPGHCIHIIVGNHNYTFLAMFAAWHLGAYCSTGDVALDAESIAGQVSLLSYE